MKAIVAMARNRAIGFQGKMPWHLPEDFAWFKRATMGGALLMGRKTFASIGRALPGRLTLIATRRGDPTLGAPNVKIIDDLAAFRPEDQAPREVWVAGGAEIYAQTLPRCTDLYLSLLDHDAEGDTFFPAFETDFPHAETIRREPGFEVVRFCRARGTV